MLSNLHSANAPVDEGGAASVLKVCRVMQEALGITFEGADERAIELMSALGLDDFPDKEKIMGFILESVRGREVEERGARRSKTHALCVVRTA